MIKYRLEKEQNEINHCSSASFYSFMVLNFIRIYRCEHLTSHETGLLTSKKGVAKQSSVFASEIFTAIYPIYPT